MQLFLRPVEIKQEQTQQYYLTNLIITYITLVKLNDYLLYSNGLPVRRCTELITQRVTFPQEKQVTYTATIPTFGRV